MLKIIKKILHAPSFLCSAKKNSPAEASLAERFMTRSKKAGADSPLILIECIEDPYYLGLFGQLVSSLRALGSVRVEQYVLRSVNFDEAQSWLRFMALRLLLNPIINQKWIGLYNSFCNGVGYKSVGLQLPGDLLDFLKAYSAWHSLANQRDLVKLSVDGISVGDLVNDTYLRFRPAPTVDVRDGYLFVVIWQAHRDVRRAKNYFSNNKVSLFITSYSTYTHHGIPVRAAVGAGVRVLSFVNYQEFVKELSLNDWMHTRDTSQYAKNFALLDQQEDRLALADQRLSERLVGVVDMATSYMKQSAYQETEALIISVKGHVVIFLHDFFDSPNVYYDMVFPDFWAWICFTIDALDAAGVPFVVKPHPNQIGLSVDVLQQLKNRYPNAIFISPKITNRQLVDGGVICAVTAYGTVSHEMAYLGVPSVTCARHPHIAFNFCYTATTVEDYANALAACPSLYPDTGEMRRESLTFYYMHNLNHSTDTVKLLDAVAVFRTHCAQPQSSIDVPKLLSELDQITEQAAYRMTVDDCYQQLLEAAS
jgi:hypothetical protein